MTSASVLVERLVGPVRTLVAERSVRQVAEYTASVGTTMAANFLIVVALVWLMSAHDYAGFVLTKATLYLIASLGSMGLSQAVVRRAAGPDSLPVFSSALAAVTVLAIPASLVLIGCFVVLGERTGITVNAGLVVASALAVVFYMLASEAINWLRARHRSGVHAVLSAIRAGFQLTAVVGLVWLVRKPIAFVWGLAVADALFLLVAMVGFRLHFAPAFCRPDARLAREMVTFGWPFAVVIAAGFLLNFADRYLISYLIPDQSMLAYYDAAYMLVGSALALIVRPFNLFLFPAYVRRHAEAGPEATIAMIVRSLLYFLIPAFTLAALLTLFSVPLLRLVFPVGYETASTIFGPVAMGIVLNGTFMGVVAGLYLAHRTIMVSIASLSALAVNVILNLMLIPLIGISGAALSTVFAFAALLVVGYLFARPILAIPIPIGLIAGGTVALGGAHLLSGWFSAIGLM